MTDEIRNPEAEALRVGEFRVGSAAAPPAPPLGSGVVLDRPDMGPRDPAPPPPSWSKRRKGRPTLRLNLTYDDMVKTIQGGGSVIHRGELVTEIDDLPDEADLAIGNEVEEDAALERLAEQRDALKRTEDKIMRARDNRKAGEPARMGAEGPRRYEPPDPTEALSDRPTGGGDVGPDTSTMFLPDGRMVARASGPGRPEGARMGGTEAPPPDKGPAPNRGTTDKTETPPPPAHAPEKTPTQPVNETNAGPKTAPAPDKDKKKS